MANICEVCGKRPRAWRSRTYSNKASKRWFKPNIFKKNIDLGNGFKVKVRMCSSCYKRLQWQGQI